MELPDDDELRRRLRIYKRRPPTKDEIPKSGEGKSTVFSVTDIGMMAKMTKYDISRFLNNSKSRKFGRGIKERIYRALLDVEQGYVTKTQLGVYHWHDTPQREQSKVMQIDLKTGRIVEAKQDKIIKLPNWKNIFGG